MADDAFTGGIKPGGLTTVKEIRILLCYLALHAPAPLTQKQMEDALLGEELVNYFELADSLADMAENGFLQKQGDSYTITDKGREIATSLERDLPATVREAALRGVICAQQFAKKQAEHHVEITPCENGCMVKCSIADLGSELFSASLYMPTRAAAQQVKQQFIQNGDTIYKLMLTALTKGEAAAGEVSRELQN